MSKKTVFSLLLFCLGLWALGIDAKFDLSRGEFSMPRMKSAPVIDGKIDKGEWKGALEINNLVKETGYLSNRSARQYFGVDENYFYYASVSDMPPKDIGLLARGKKRDGAVYMDDSVEFLFCPPQEDFSYHFIANSLNFSYDKKYPIVNGGVTTTDFQEWNPDVKSASVIDDKHWVFEMQIPLKDMGVEGGLKPGQVFHAIAGHNWNSPWGQTTLKRSAGAFCDPNSMAKFTYNPGRPYVCFKGLGKKFMECDHDIVFTVSNPGKKERRVAYQVRVTSDAAPRQAENVVVVQPGKTEKVELKFAEQNRVQRQLFAYFVDEGSKQVLFDRTFIWDPGDKVTWVDPGRKTAQLEFGVYPGFGKVKARYGSPSEKVPNDKKALFGIYKQDGTAVKTQAGAVLPYGYETMFDIQLPAGEYKIALDLTGKDGGVIHQEQPFKIEKFPWEGNKIGCDRIIIPPFKPLTYSGEREVKATLTGYSFRNGFFDKISSLDTENILAAPIQLFINGKPTRELSFKFTEKSEDRARTSSELAWDGGKINILGEFDYDGFCKFTMKFQPQGRQSIQSADLRIPLKAEIAELMHATCDKIRFNKAGAIPAGQGIVWRSSETQITPKLRGNFHPYIWMGGLEKGLSWCCESDKYWSVGEDQDSQTLERIGNAVVLHINMVSKPTVWDGDFTVQQAFEATPVKPQPRDWRKITERINYPNGINCSCLAGASCWGAGLPYQLFAPVNYDYSFLHYLRDNKFSEEADKKFVEDFIQRNTPEYSEDQKRFMRNHLHRGIWYKRSSQRIYAYTNARVSRLDWQEYDTYMDEWWCAEFRAKNADEYNITPVPSYRDMVLYNLRRLVREGLDGLNYDNIRDWCVPNPVSGPAYRRADGTIQPYFDIFDTRELIKRTAIMLYQEKKVYPLEEPRPLFTLHMTNTLIIPLAAFGTTGGDQEMEYGSKDYQDRFPEDYIKTCSLSKQAGLIPHITIQITGKNQDFVTRTFLGVAMAYDLPNMMDCGGVKSIWISTWKKLYGWGYSTDEVQVYPCWTKETLKTTCPDWRTVTYVKPSTRETIVGIVNMKDAAEGHLELGTLSGECVDWESGEKLPMENGRVKISLPRHEMKILKITADK